MGHNVIDLNRFSFFGSRRQLLRVLSLQAPRVSGSLRTTRNLNLPRRAASKRISCHRRTVSTLDYAFHVNAGTTEFD